MKEKLDELAKQYSCDYAKKVGFFNNLEVWSFDTEKTCCIGYPVFALLENDNIKILQEPDENYEDVFHWAMAQYPDDDED